jgi:hypothetical protein
MLIFLGLFRERPSFDTAIQISVFHTVKSEPQLSERYVGARHVCVSLLRKAPVFSETGSSPSETAKPDNPWPRICEPRLHRRSSNRDIAREWLSTDSVP